MVLISLVRDTPQHPCDAGTASLPYAIFRFLPSFPRQNTYGATIQSRLYADLPSLPAGAIYVSCDLWSPFKLRNAIKLSNKIQVKKVIWLQPYGGPPTACQVIVMLLYNNALRRPPSKWTNQSSEKLSLPHSCSGGHLSLHLLPDRFQLVQGAVGHTPALGPYRVFQPREPRTEFLQCLPQCDFRLYLQLAGK